MVAYHNDPEIKQRILNQLKAHYDADEIVKGRYWENGKGCAVGCTIYGSDHSEYETLFGIPIILAILEDRLFERLPTNRAKDWPIRFMSSIRVGVDLSLVWPKFAHWMITNPTSGLIRTLKDDKEACSLAECVADLYTEIINGNQVSRNTWRRAAALLIDCSQRIIPYLVYKSVVGINFIAEAAVDDNSCHHCVEYSGIIDQSISASAVEKADQLIELLTSC